MGIVEDVINGFMDNRKKQNQPQNYSGGNSTAIVSSVSGSSSKISEDDALSISSVAASVDLIASTIARLPVEIYKKGSKGENIQVEDNRLFLLNREPNSTQNAVTLKKRIIQDYLLHGNSYVYPEWSRNEVTALYHIKPEEVFIEKYADNNLPFIVKGIIKVQTAKGTVIELTPDELMIVLKNSEDGLSSKGVLDLNAELLGLALNQQEYTNSLLENGSLPIAVLSSPSRLTEKTVARIRDSWKNVYTGGKNAGKTVVLEEGMQYNPVSLNPNEMDLSSSKKSTMADIARVFGIPESMINADANKYNSNEQNNIHFLQYALSPVISALESAMERSLLLEEEKKKGYRVRLDTSSILATTEAEKVESTIKSLSGGLISMNEARRKHNYKEIPDDYMMLSLGSIFYDKTNSKMIIPNMGAIIDPNDPESMAKALGKTDETSGSSKEVVKDDVDKDVKEDDDKEKESSEKVDSKDSKKESDEDK